MRLPSIFSCYFMCATSWVEKPSDFIIPCPSWSFPPGLVPPVCIPPIIRCKSQFLSVSRVLLFFWFSMMPLCRIYIWVSVHREVPFPIVWEPYVSSWYNLWILTCFFVHADRGPRSFMIVWTTFHRDEMRWGTISRATREVFVNGSHPNNNCRSNCGTRQSDQTLSWDSQHNRRRARATLGTFSWKGLSPYILDGTESDTTQRIVPVVPERHCA